MYFVGQKVVCISDSWKIDYGEKCPVKDAVYTVRTLKKAEHGPFKGRYFLRLVEIVNCLFDYGCGAKECAFVVSGFRPVVETDISIFKAMLNPIDHDADNLAADQICALYPRLDFRRQTQPTLMRP